MKKTIFYSTDQHNSYLYNIDRSLSMLIHPELKNAHDNVEDVDPYYLDKYQYLKEMNFFEEAKPVEFGKVLEESVVKENINQLQELVFETTDFCNLSCTYCSLGDLYTFAKKERKHINTSHAIDLLKYIFDKKSDGAELAIGFFGGEPLMNFDFIKNIVLEARRLSAGKSIELKFLMTTNATLLDKYMLFLVENDFNLLISLDGDEMAQSYRTFAKGGKSSFEKVIKNVDKLYQEYPAFFAKNVSFNSVLHDRNSVQRIYEFIYDRYQKIAAVAQLNVDHVNPNKKDVLDKMYRSRRKGESDFHKTDSFMLQKTHEFAIRYKELNSFVSDYSINFYLTNPLDMLYDEVLQIPTKTCSPFQRKMYLNTSSQILPCEKVSYQYAMGHINDTGITFDIQRVIDEFNTRYTHFEKICQHCYNRKTCSVCMLTLDNLDRLGTSEFTCVNYMTDDEFKDVLYRVFSYFEQNRDDYWSILSTEILK